MQVHFLEQIQPKGRNLELFSSEPLELSSVLGTYEVLKRCWLKETVGALGAVVRRKRKGNPIYRKGTTDHLLLRVPEDLYKP